MRALDWERLLSEHRVPYITAGPNVKRGEISIQCPFCGSADPSKHMGLNLETGWWSCWRNRAQHSGKSPIRLLMRLLGVPYGRAREIAGLGDDYVDPDGFDAIAARVMGRDKDVRPAQVERRFLDLEDGMLAISRKGRTHRFWDYLYDRGFSGASRAGEDVDVLCDLYNLRAGTRGVWTDRVIIPYYQDQRLVTWTGRAIATATIKYRDLSRDDSLVPPKETLFNHDCMLESGKALVLVEGPIDALKLDFYGRPWGVRAVALSTNSATDAQLFLLQSTIKFDRLFTMMDSKTFSGLTDSMRMKQALAFLPNVKPIAVPFGAGDAGELNPNQVIQWAQAL